MTFRVNKIIFTEKDDLHGPPSPIMKRTNSAEYRDVEVRDIYLRRSKVTGKIKLREPFKILAPVSKF